MAAQAAAARARLRVVRFPGTAAAGSEAEGEAEGEAVGKAMVVGFMKSP